MKETLIECRRTSKQSGLLVEIQTRRLNVQDVARRRHEVVQRGSALSADGTGIQLVNKIVD
jgi:hypothetical protein